VRLLPSLSLLSLLFACSPPPEPEPEVQVTLFGKAVVTVVATSADGLSGPRDLDFNPEIPTDLWVVNRTDDRTITISDVGTPEQVVLVRKDPFALHFMEETSSISFSTSQQFGTCGETRNTYDGQAAFNDFMGPALWSADPALFAISNPEAVDFLGYDLGSHLDMMHETPWCMGIAWVNANIYYVFEGLNSTIARYDFKRDHGPGFDDHSDGTVERFIDVDVLRVADVPSHMVYDPIQELLYVADTGNSRIAVLDPTTASVSDEFPGKETMVQELLGAGWSSLVRAGGVADLQQPSGIALRDGVLYVSDNLTSRITAFALDGTIIDFIDLDIEEGGLMGIRVSPEGDSLYAVDYVGEQVLKIDGLVVPVQP
jgi:hypothetical protein